jgi:hypothetical protein
LGTGPGRAFDEVLNSPLQDELNAFVVYLQSEGSIIIDALLVLRVSASRLHIGFKVSIERVIRLHRGKAHKTETPLFYTNILLDYPNLRGALGNVGTALPGCETFVQIRLNMRRHMYFSSSSLMLLTFTSFGNERT